MPTKSAVKQDFSALSRQKKREIFARKRHLFSLPGVRELVGAYLSPQCLRRALPQASLAGGGGWGGEGGAGGGRGSVWPKAQI